MSRRVSSRSVISVLTACLALLISVAGFTDAVSQRAPAAQPSPTATSSPRAPTPVPAQPILEPLDPTTGEDAAADGSPAPAAVQAAVGSRLAFTPDTHTLTGINTCRNRNFNGLFIFNITGTAAV